MGLSAFRGDQGVSAELVRTEVLERRRRRKALTPLHHLIETTNGMKGLLGNEQTLKIDGDHTSHYVQNQGIAAYFGAQTDLGYPTATSVSYVSGEGDAESKGRNALEIAVTRLLDNTMYHYHRQGFGRDYRILAMTAMTATLNGGVVKENKMAETVHNDV
jgi:hypothetical protein